MEFCGSRILVALVILLSYVISDFCCATDAITSSQSIQDPGTIISSGGTFRMGFFSPGNSTNRYVGIWFNDVSPTTVVWVANRSKPLNDSSGIVTISEDGNPVVLNGQKEVLWSSNVSNSASNSSTGAQLLDSGNLVLREKSKRTSLWESFQEPTDTFLPTMKLTTNIRTGEKVQLTSWKSPSDPSVGRFSGGVDPLNVPEVCTWKDNKPLWRSGPWNGRVFLGIPNMTSVYLNGYNLVVDNQEGTASYSFAFSNNSMLFHVLNSEGILEVRDWIPGKKNWEVIYLLPTDVCDAYGTCGAFGVCDSLKKPICSSLRGF